MFFDGWCPDCDLKTAVVDTGDGTDGGAWATCTECEAGWVWRDETHEAPAERSSAPRRDSAAARQAA